MFGTKTKVKKTMCGIAEKLLKDYSKSLSAVVRGEKWAEYVEHVKTCPACKDPNR